MSRSRIEGTTSIITGTGGGGGGVPDDGSVTTAKIVDGAVTSGKIFDGTIVNADIAPGAAIATTKLSPDPLARANHTGTQLAATVSNFDTQVRTSRLDQMATPTATVDFGGQVITDVAEPVGDTDAATKLYVDTNAGEGGGGIPDGTLTANSVLKADVDDVPLALTVAPSTFVGRGAAGAIAALTGTQAKTVLGIVAADVSDFNTAVRTSRLDQMATPTASVALGNQTITGLGTPANPTDAVTKAYVDSASSSGVSASLFDANTVLKADTDNTPIALVVNPSTLVGRGPSGGITGVDTATVKSMLAFTAGDVSGLGTLASKSTITSADITDGTITSGDIADATIVNADIALGAAIDLAKLSVDPLARANHTGTQLAATISNFDTAVRTSRLDQMAIPTAPVNVNGQVVTGVATPGVATDATNKAYVDNVAAGLDFKSSVKACATTNVTIASPGATIDGVTLSSGGRVLLAGQTDATENGIYVWNGAASAMTRATDADADAEVTSGMYVFVESGTANGAKAYVLTTPDPIVVGTTALSFTLFSGGGTSVVGTANRITVTGTQIDISPAYVGQASITTLGTITTGVWNGVAVPVAFGGTGATTAAQARTNLGITGGKYITTIGNGALTSFTVTHNLNSKDIVVELYETATGLTVLADITRTTVNAITVTGFTVAPTAGQYSVVVMG